MAAYGTLCVLVCYEFLFETIKSKAFKLRHLCLGIPTIETEAVKLWPLGQTYVTLALGRSLSIKTTTSC